MEGTSVEGFTPSTPPNSKSTPISGETNENHQMGASKLTNPNKKPAMKHFMSPTISAATKAAAVSRKKILAERNEGFTNFTNNPQFPKPPILDSITSPIISGTARSIRSSYNSASETDDDDEQKTYDADWSLKKSYDPLTNYLSPRPKFLRYNPNRRRNIFLHGENEITEGKDGLAVPKTSVSSDSEEAVVGKNSSEEGSVKEEDERVDKSKGNHKHDHEEMEEVEEIEEFEEENCWSLTWVLKILLLLGAFFLSNSYICSMNSPNPSQMQEAIWGFREGFQKIHGDMNEVVPSFESGIGLLAENERDMDHMLEEKIVEEDDVDRGLVESSNGLSEVVEVQNEQCYYFYNDRLVNKSEIPDQLDGIENAEKSESFQDDAIFDAFETEGIIHLNSKDEQLEGEEKIRLQERTTFGKGKEVEIVEDTYSSALEEIFKSGRTGSDTEKLELDKIVLVADALEHLFEEAILEVLVPVFVLLTIGTVFGLVYHLWNEKNAIKEEQIERVKSFESPAGDSSLGSCGMRRKIREDSESKSNSVYAEMKISVSKAPSSDQSKGHSSTANSPSYGSSAAEMKKVVKKEQGKGGKGMSMAITTPVRRSSRIRNRQMSP